MMPVSIPQNIDKYFFNRKKDITLLNLYISSIYEDLPNQILLTGKRGIGKTFLLKKILNDQKEDIITIYLDISKIYGENKRITEEEILKELLQEMNKIIEKKSNNKIKTKLDSKIKKMKLKKYDINDSTDLFKITLPKIKENYSKLSKFVMELPQDVVDSTNNINGVIIVIDEFQLIKYTNNPEAFFWLIRSYLQNQANVCYIFTGSISNTADIIEMVNGQTGAFGGRMAQININPFTIEETKNYICEKMPELKFTKDGFDRFYKCTGGIPAYINTFCNVLDKTEVYDSEKIKKTFLVKMDQIVIMWLYIWGRLNSNEKEIIKNLVEDDLTGSELLKKCSFSKATLYKYIDSLNNQGMIEYTYENKYSLNDEMIRTWLKHKKETEGQYPL